ncbi:LysR family transcriptional regulator [Caballeronia sp. ATUFL_M1_KS5A]|uniref:LysR family transcriptional regulator n=1 Tax=Caballeronia sp. ATUFL_M1_KS5A TaxID=2921778 RepID=UPI002027E563|nr:LysR family transcriptional regulator [Caballeronia sp. ATUFL_M1_KS5A]
MTSLLDDEAAERMFLQLHNLRIIASAAACGSATAAGHLLFKSASTITRGIGEVEQAIGLTLFERGPAGFIPNLYGRILVERIRRIRDEMDLVEGEFVRAKTKGSRVSTGALSYLLHSGRKLLLLIHLADKRNFADAAGQLKVTQSGASMALGRIEDSLGVRLFFRGMQGLTPTDEASKLILHAKRMRAELRHAASELSSVAGSLVGTTIIGTLPMARTDILPRAIGRCLARYPNIQVQTVEAPGAVLISQLRSGEIDAVLSVPGPGFEPAGLLVEPLFRDELVVVASPTHPLAGRRGLTLAEIATWKCILPRRHSVSRTMFERACDDEGIKPPKAAVETADLLLMRLLLADREMLALTSLSYVQYELTAGILSRIDVRMTPIERDVALLRRDAMTLSPAATSLIDEIRATTCPPA